MTVPRPVICILVLLFLAGPASAEEAKFPISEGDFDHGMIYHLGGNGLCLHGEKSYREVNVHTSYMKGYKLDWDYVPIALNSGQCLTGHFIVSNSQRWGFASFTLFEYGSDDDTNKIARCSVKLRGGWKNPKHHHHIESWECKKFKYGDPLPGGGRTRTTPSDDDEYHTGHGSHTFHVDIEPNEK